MGLICCVEAITQILLFSFKESDNGEGYLITGNNIANKP